jgi:hypothetical protein
MAIQAHDSNPFCLAGRVVLASSLLPPGRMTIETFSRCIRRAAQNLFHECFSGNELPKRHENYGLKSNALSEVDVPGGALQKSRMSTAIIIVMAAKNHPTATITSATKPEIIIACQKSQNANINKQGNVTTNAQHRKKL